MDAELVVLLKFDEGGIISQTPRTPELYRELPGASPGFCSGCPSLCTATHKSRERLHVADTDVLKTRP